MVFDENGLYTGDAVTNLNENVKKVNRAAYGGLIVWHNEGQGFLAQLVDAEHNPVLGGTTWNYHETAPKAIERAAGMAEENPVKR